MLVNEFKSHLMSSSAENTAIAYNSDVSNMIKYVEKSVRKIERSDLEKWVKYISTGSAATVNRKISAVQSFYKWVEKRKNITDISKELPRPTTGRVQKNTLSADQIDSILDNSSLKYRTLFLFGADAGSRIGEPINLNVEDIDFELNTFKVIGDKRHNTRIVPMSRRLKESLQEYLSETGIKSGKVFDIRENSARKTVKRVFEKSGVVYGENIGFTYHSFRHAFVTKAIVQRVDLKIISEIVGATVKTLQENYVHPSTEDKRNVIEEIWN